MKTSKIKIYSSVLSLIGFSVFLLSCNGTPGVSAPSLARQGQCSNWSWHAPISLMTGNTGNVSPSYTGPGRRPAITTLFRSDTANSTLRGTSITAGSVTSATIIGVVVRADDGCSGTTAVTVYPTMSLAASKAVQLSTEVVSLTTTGGVPPFTYSYLGSVNPSGLLSASGTSGTYTPGTGEVNRLVFTVTDANSNTSSATVISLGAPGIRMEADAINGDGVAVPNNGDAIATWVDLSGNGNNFTQAVAGKKPVYRTGIQNGLAAVHFKDDGNLDDLQGTDFLNSTDVTMFMVGVAGAGAQAAFSDMGTGGVQSILLGSGGGVATTYLKDSASNMVSVGSGASTSWMLFGGRMDGANKTVYNNYNGTEYTTTNAAYDNTTTFENAAGGLPTIGSLPDQVSRAWGGYIGTMIVYPELLSQSQMDVLTCYYAGKYAITASITCP